MMGENNRKLEQNAAIKSEIERIEETVMDRKEDIREMIQKEIQSISALEERVVFKDMIEGVFLSLYEKNEEMYKALETRVMDDLAYDINRYRICTGLVENAYFDMSHHLLTAVCVEDTKPDVHSIAELRETAIKDGKVSLSTIFIKGDVLEIQDLLKKESVFPGILKTDKEYPVSVRIEPCTRYLKKMEKLYHLFMKNGIPWQTINAPYLFKMMDLVVYNIPKEISDSEVVKGVRIDFGKYASLIHYDVTPLWNVWQLTLESTGFPIPCGDHENFEYVISIKEYGTQNVYLMEDKAGIQSVRQNGSRLLITGQAGNKRKWNVYMVKSGGERRIDKHTYPIMENIRKDGFGERFQKKNGRRVKTKGEFERFIRGFGLEEYIEYQGCQLEDGNGKKKETYSMNFFIKDEIREQKGRRILVLFFKARGNEKWILRDIASFIVSEVQELYPEYQCEGRVL